MKNAKSLSTLLVFLLAMFFVACEPKNPTAAEKDADKTGATAPEVAKADAGGEKASADAGKASADAGKAKKDEKKAEKAEKKAEEKAEKKKEE
jgi:hypothetical protein